MPQNYLVASPDVNQEPLSDAKIREAEEKDMWDGKSITKSYHRVRFEGLPEYVKSLQEYDKEKLISDARRIQRSRECLSKTAKSKELFSDLAEAFKEWRSDAEERGVKFKHSSSDRAQYFKALGFAGVSINNEAIEEADRDAAHDFKTGVIFFEKCGGGWRKTSHHGNGFDKYEKFPNQKMTVHKALFDKDHNPFVETKDEQGRRHLKYIHLPANHMEWVEVRSFPSFPSLLSQGSTF